MDISSSTALQTTTQSGQAATAQPTALSSDFETFLEMLTAQARYQDPLEPIDSTEYAAQLAQFSMVEQQVRTNDMLSMLISQTATSNVGNLASWIGTEVRAVASAHFDGNPITISPNPAAVSDQVSLSVRNDAGEEIQRITLPISAEPYEWSGLDDFAEPFPNGQYSFVVESYANDELVLTEAAETYGQVVEAQVADGDVLLILEGGSAILASSVTALRANN